MSLLKLTPSRRPRCPATAALLSAAPTQQHVSLARCPVTAAPSVLPPAPAPTTTETSKTAAAAEDEIDWDDDNPTEAAKTASTEAGAAAIAAGGKGQVANPQAVPNQEAAVDPSKTDDLSVKPEQPGNETAVEPAEGNEAAVEAEKKDFASGLKDVSLD